MATIGLAGLGASLRFLPVIGDADRWIGTSFITLAVVCASYAVFAAGIFFGPAVAARAFRTTVIGGATVGALIVVLAALRNAAALLRRNGALRRTAERRDVIVRHGCDLGSVS